MTTSSVNPAGKNEAKADVNVNPVFGLYEEDETRPIDQKPLASIPENERLDLRKDEETARSPPQAIKQSLRSISLPKGPQPASSSPTLQHASSIGNVDSASQITLPEAKKSKKSVRDYYNKQNELLENFKNDNEQIQVFQKTKTRQRLESTSSQSGPSSDTCVTTVSNPVEEPKAPLLANVDDDVEVVVKGSGYLHPNNNCNEKADTISHESLLIRHELAADKSKDESKAAARFAMITLLTNISLMIAKAIASYLSGSLSIISSLVDSVVDITSGLVIWICTRMIKKRDPYLYPRGRTRLEPLSLIIISVVMGVASIQLIVDAGRRIYVAIEAEAFGIGTMPSLEMTWPTVGIMVATVAIKGTLYFICQRFNDPSIEVLAMDHRNDCISNVVALACAWLGKRYWYYLDPIGAIIVSFYILYTWTNTGYDHLTKLCGKTASPEFINRIIKVCIDHDERITHLDTVYVYHYGTKFLVEVHIVLDERMSLKEAHDISETLQTNIESLPDVERAFVHPDYNFDHHPEEEHLPPKV